MRSLLLFLLGTLAFIEVSACDVCTFYFGLNPNYNLNQVGLRYRTRSIVGSHTHVGETVHTNVETYQGLDLIGRYCPSPKVRLWAIVPLNRNHTLDDQNRNNIYSGLGDIILSGDFQIAQSEGDVNHRVFAKAGLSLPTGPYQNLSRAGSLDYTIQTGSGAFSFMTGAKYIAGVGKFGFAADLTGRYFLKNPRELRFGHRLIADLSLRYEIAFPKIEGALYPVVGLFGEVAARDQFMDYPFENSGGALGSLKTGAEFYVSRYSFSAMVQTPVVQARNGDQGDDRPMVLIGSYISF